VKFYEFVDKAPAIGKLVIVEGTERALAESAIDVLLDRLLPIDVRELNLERIPAMEFTDGSRVREAVQAMPFLAERRVVLVSDAQTLKAQPRRDLWDAAQAVPAGNTLVIADLVSPRSQRPQPLGALAGRAALRIDTTANEDVRERYVRELLAELHATAEPRVVAALASSEADLTAVSNDLQKLALGGKKITYAELEQESLAIEDPKAYKYASAIAEGRAPEAFGIASDLFANDPRGAAIPLLSALATEFGLIWELARAGGELPSRFKWRERVLRPLAGRIGERRARVAHERAVRGVEAIVTGQAGSDPGDHRALVDRIGFELSGLARTAAR
jgi:DNA polymerase III delta subunit